MECVEGVLGAGQLCVGHCGFGSLAQQLHERSGVLYWRRVSRSPWITKKGGASSRTWSRGEASWNLLGSSVSFAFHHQGLDDIDKNPGGYSFSRSTKQYTP